MKKRIAVLLLLLVNSSAFAAAPLLCKIELKNLSSDGWVTAAKREIKYDFRDSLRKNYTLNLSPVPADSYLYITYVPGSRPDEARYDAQLYVYRGDESIRSKLSYKEVAKNEEDNEPSKFISSKTMLELDCKPIVNQLAKR